MNEKTLTLHRIYYADRTESRLYDGNKFLCLILERPWLDDQPNISCVPETLQDIPARFDAHNGPKLKDVWGELNPADGRSGICVHAANFVRQLEGCLAPGYSWGYIENENGQEEYGIQSSHAALEFLKEYIGRDINTGVLNSFYLTIDSK